MISEPNIGQWQAWARKLAALAQSGLAYTDNPFEVERYQQVREVAAAMTAALMQAEPQTVKAAFDAQCGYATPKLDVRGVVLQDGLLLLVQEAADGLWTLPGGWVDVGETPSGAAVREVREESGFEVRVSRLLAVYDRDRHDYPPHPFQIYKLFFLCEITGGQPTPSFETAAVRFFDRSELTGLRLGKINLYDLMLILNLAADPVLPVDFD